MFSCEIFRYETAKFKNDQKLVYEHKRFLKAQKETSIPQKVRDHTRGYIFSVFKESNQRFWQCCQQDDELICNHFNDEWCYLL